MHLFQLHTNATVCTIFQVHYEHFGSQTPYQDAIALMKVYMKMLLLSISFSGKAFGLDAGSQGYVKRSSVLEKLPVPAQILSVANSSLTF